MRPTIEHIIGASAWAHGVDPTALASPLRGSRKITMARRVCACVMRDERGMSYPEIAEALGLRAHSSVQRLVKDTRPDPISIELVAALSMKIAKRQDRYGIPHWARPAVPVHQPDTEGDDQ